MTAGRSGIEYMTQFDPSGLDIQFGGELKGFSAEGYVSPRDLRHMDRSVQVGVVAAKQAVADAGLELPDPGIPRERVGIYLGSASGGFRQLLKQQEVLQTRGPDRVSPFYLPHFIDDTASGVLAIALGAEGPNMASSPPAPRAAITLARPARRSAATTRTSSSPAALRRA